MPANLTAEAKAKWQLAQAAKNPREKLKAYQEFLSEMPKHKGNEHLQAQIKTKIAALKQEIELQRGKRSSGRSGWTLERAGAAQVIIFGPTQSGKSSLLRLITHATVEIGTYDYCTQMPVPGILQFEDVQLQLVELPAPQIAPDLAAYDIQPAWADLIRQCDGLLLMVDLTNEPLGQLQRLLQALETIHVSTQKMQSRVEIVPEKGAGEIRLAVSGARDPLPHEQVAELLHSYGIKNALVRVFGNATMDDVENAILQNVMLYKPTVVIANKLDRDAGEKGSYQLASNVTELPLVVVSCLTGQGVSAIGNELLKVMEIFVFYTKEPNEAKPSEHPFVVRAGTTVGELAQSIHTDLAKRYRYSRIWGTTSKFAGERVGPEHLLGDRDIVEIHAD